MANSGSNADDQNAPGACPDCGMVHEDIMNDPNFTMMEGSWEWTRIEGRNGPQLELFISYKSITSIIVIDVSANDSESWERFTSGFEQAALRLCAMAFMDEEGPMPQRIRDGIVSLQKLLNLDRPEDPAVN